MSLLTKSVIAGLSILGLVMSFNPVLAGKGGRALDSNSVDTLDFNERTHLEFMCEEEKLARDVYITLGSLYPQSKVFGQIDDSEQRHKSAVEDVLEKYSIPSPSTNDNVGVFTGEAFGWYFTEKYNALVEQGAESEMNAWYVGAFIEELDMLDINQCPQVVVDTDNGINDVSGCGKIYTDKSDIQRLYGSLLEGSENHLRAYVKVIEREIGSGNYSAQLLTQEQVDAILGR